VPRYRLHLEDWPDIALANSILSYLTHRVWPPFAQGGLDEALGHAVEATHLGLIANQLASLYCGHRRASAATVTQSTNLGAVPTGTGATVRAASTPPSGAGD
jgi:hypothetical protein